MDRIDVEFASDRHPVFIGRDILGDLGSLIPEEMRVGKVALITNPTVDALYGDRVRKALAGAGCDVATIEVPDTEKAKSLREVERLCGHMIKGGLDRKSHVLALGGGVVGDLAGFVASSYMRGIGFVNVPTTLLAQVDSAIGGKTGVDLEHGKNLVGAFHQPRAVISDTSTLTTLPDEVFKGGLAEVVKYGVITDAEFFGFLEGNVEDILDREPETMTRIVSRCAAIKAEVVMEDEREQGRREILNFGHTLGHAIEAASGYDINHGEAVAIGMAYAARLGSRLSGFDGAERLEKLLTSLGLPVNVGEGRFTTGDIIGYMRADKKVRSGNIRFIIPNTIGEVTVTDAVTEELLKETLEGVFR